MADDVEFTLPELDGRPRRRKQTKKKVCKNKKLVMKLQLSTILMVFQLEREEMILGVTLESLYVKQFQFYLMIGGMCHWR